MAEEKTKDTQFKVELLFHLYPDEIPPEHYKNYFCICQDQYGRMLTEQQFLSPERGWTWEDTEVFAWAEIPELNFKNEKG